MKIHLDLDAFFISAERIKNPFLRGKPAAVGGRGDPFIFQRSDAKMECIANKQGAFVPSMFYDANSTFADYFCDRERVRGIIVTSSYEARKYGVKTGMTIKEALQLCPSLVVVPPNHLYYHSLSHELHLFLQSQIPLVEQFSIDEFFGDLSGYVQDRDLLSFLYCLQKRIEDRFKLPISIGAAKSKWIAKLATSYAKPHGVKVVEDIPSFIRHIPIEKFPGIGRGYLKRLKGYGISYLGETKDIYPLFASWKRPGITLYKRIWGEDNEPILPKSPRKSLGISRTMDPIVQRAEIKRRITVLCRHLSYSLFRYGLSPTFYAISIKYETGQKSKAHTISSRMFSEKMLIDTALELFGKCDISPTEAIVRIGVRCGRFYGAKEPNLLTLLYDKKLKKLSSSNQKIRKKYGINVLQWGVELL